MPYKEEETETVLPFRGGFRRGSWNARRALLRPLYCLLVGDNISVLLSALGTREALMAVLEIIWRNLQKFYYFICIYQFFFVPFIPQGNSGT